ncbi:MAG: glycosyltransferase family 4 protein [Acidobacteria bacterium]|nr:glycosyltransferase family 4 protein [Acidobacteriota bacterium]
MRDLFDAMVNHAGMDLRVHYLEMAAPDTYWGDVLLPEYADVLTGGWFWFLDGRIHYNPGAARRVLAERPDVAVVAGYSGLTNQLVMRALRRRRIPWVFYGELPGMNRHGLVRRALRRIAQKPAVRWPSAIAAIGSKAAASYRALAPDDCPVYNIPYCCDMQPFIEMPRRANPNGGVRFLYCGQLIERKGADLLLDSFLPVARENLHATLTFVGEGPLRQALQQRVPHELVSRICFTGFQPVAELPRWFAKADVLVLPSRHDGWGVVVNQGLAGGMAVVCSDAVGAAADLVKPYVNGLIFPSGDGQSLRQLLFALAGRPNRAEEMGQRSREIALGHTPRQAVERWNEVLSAVLSARPRRHPE